MNLSLLIDNLTNPALLFYLLGLFAVMVKSDLKIPANSSKFISFYLLFSIGFRGGQELAHSVFTIEIIYYLVFGVLIASCIPLYTFFILKRKLSIADSGAVAATYGSISAVTFVTAVLFLETNNIFYNGYMVAVMAVMEAPAIIIGVTLIRLYNKENDSNLKDVIKHSLTNGSVLLIVGSLLIGWLANDKQAEGIKPFTSDLFLGFLAVFLLDMGITSGKKLSDFVHQGWFTILFAILIPFINGCVTAVLAAFILRDTGDAFLFSILAASASYIAVPAAMRMAVPQSNPSLYLPMALAVTFPFNITLGMPVYLTVIEKALSVI